MQRRGSSPCIRNVLCAMHMLERRVRRARLIVANARWTMTRPFFPASAALLFKVLNSMQWRNFTFTSNTHTRAYGLASHHDTTNLLILGVARQGGGHSARSVLAFPLPRVFGGE